MQRLFTGIVVLMWALVLLGGAFRPRPGAAGDSEASTRPQPGYAAPALHAADLQGRPVDLAQLRGKAVMLNFWASWCGPCRLEMPEVQRLSAELPPGTALLTVSTDTISDDALRAFLTEHGYSFPVVRSESAETDYRVVSLPTSLFINADGVVTARVSGPLTYGAMLGYLKAAGR